MGSPTVNWNPDQYLKFGDHRLRPALDLLERIDLKSPRAMYDLGCGTGNTTELLSRRWPDSVTDANAICGAASWQIQVLDIVNP